jgi:hypothetical protein
MPFALAQPVFVNTASGAAATRTKTPAEEAHSAKLLK